MARRVAIIGAGSWGSALAILAARAGHDVQIWSRNTEVVHSISRDHVNPLYLKGARFGDSVRATEDLAEAVTEAELIVLAAPSHATRGLLTTMAPSLKEVIIVS